LFQPVRYFGRSGLLPNRGRAYQGEMWAPANWRHMEEWRLSLLAAQSCCLPTSSLQTSATEKLLKRASLPFALWAEPRLLRQRIALLPEDRRRDAAQIAAKDQQTLLVRQVGVEHFR